MATCLADLVRRLGKWLARLVTGQCELERICHAGVHGAAMTVAVIGSLRRSRQLRQEARLALVAQAAGPASARLVDDVCQRVVTVKRFPAPHSRDRRGLGAEICRQNLRLSVDSCLWVRAVAERVLALRDLPVDREDPTHEAMLDRLWEHLRPGVRRAGGKLTSEWGEVGFQGQDPTTDFRGMGLLALLQLEHYATAKAGQARQQLASMSDPRVYCPFAATGINVTAFVLELLEQGLLHGRLLAAAEARLLDQGGGAAVDQARAEGRARCEDAALVAVGVTSVHEVFAEVYGRFGDAWVAARPSSIMDFPVIFAAFKATVRAELEGGRVAVLV